MKTGYEFPELFRGIMLGHLILLLHVLLLGGVGILVIFFHGLISYLPLILFSGLVLIAAGSYALFRWMRARGKHLKDIVNSPALSGRSVEISLLGGIASIKIDSRGNAPHPAVTQPAVRAALTSDQKPSHIIELPEPVRNIDPSIDSDIHKRDKRRFFKWKN